MQFKDFYATLGVAPDASDGDIKSAYRRLARKYHPDVSKEPDAEARFKEISEAYEVLGDAKKRAGYDQLRAQGYRPGEEFRPPPGFGGEGAGGFGNIDLGDLLDSLFGGGAGRGHARGGGRRSAARDLRATLRVPLETIFAGGQQRIEVDGRTLDVRIPAGIAEGQTIRLSGQGHQGGHLLLEVAYAPHPRFRVEGRDVIAPLRLAPWNAALGHTATVPTLAGEVQLKIPAGSDSGRRLRLRGRGLPGDPPGDQYVELQIAVPAAHDDAQRDAWERLRAAYEKR